MSSSAYTQLLCRTTTTRRGESGEQTAATKRPQFVAAARPNARSRSAELPLPFPLPFSLVWRGKQREMRIIIQPRLPLADNNHPGETQCRICRPLPDCTARESGQQSSTLASRSRPSRKPSPPASSYMEHRCPI
eukprot:1191439-Prorocentrum_minimum.AAC.1